MPNLRVCRKAAKTGSSRGIAVSLTRELFRNQYGIPGKGSNTGVTFPHP